MTLDQIQVLQSIVKVGSFRLASKDLQRAQSAVSYAVTTLEKELGFALFSRDDYRPKLTSRGRAFLKKADTLMAQFGELSSTVEFLKRGHEPKLRLALSAHLPLPSLVVALRNFANRFPETEIQIVRSPRRSDEQFLRDEVDMMVGPSPGPSPHLITEELAGITRLACIAGKHPVVKSKTRSAKDLSTARQIILESETTENGATNVIQVQDLQTQKSLVLAGLGWAYLPEITVSAEIKSKELAPLNLKPLKTKLALMRHSERELGPCADFLWQQFSNRQKTKSK